MTTLLYATSNRPKVLSLRRRLKPYRITVRQASLMIPEPRLDTVEDLAVFKAIFARQELDGPVLTNDSAFYVERLNGFPGTNVKFGLSTIGIDGIVQLAAGSHCWFQHALAFHDSETTVPVVFSNTVHGHVASAVLGVRQDWHWSALSLIFVPDGSEKTLGEMSEDEWAAHQDATARGPHYATQFAAWYHQHRSPIHHPPS